MIKRWTALLLALLLLLPLCGSAESGSWTCPGCGQTGNTGNYCSNCASPRPDGSWTCPGCGQAGNTGNYCSNCASPRPDSSSGSAVQVNENLEQIPGETDRVMVVVARVDASSYIKNKQDPYRWHPEKATDGNETTCWQFSAKKGLKGKSWIALTFASPQAVDEIWFKNGFWAVNDKGKDQYVLNARPKEVRISFGYQEASGKPESISLTLKDESRNGWQRFPLGRHENVESIQVSVVSIYPGSAFPKDVCLSEVMPVQIASAETARPAQAAQAEVVYESSPEITGCNLTDKLATRSGPGTQYAEPGTFFGKNYQSQTVKVLSKSFDGSVWWVQVDFRNGKKSSYRVWTGAKRVDVDLNKLREEKRICDCDIYPTSDTWFGPGGNYARANISINRSAVGRIFQKENGYVDVEYWYEDDGFDGSHRLWLPESAVYNLYYGDYSGE